MPNGGRGVFACTRACVYISMYIGGWWTQYFQCEIVLRDFEEIVHLRGLALWATASAREGATAYALVVSIC